MTDETEKPEPPKKPFVHQLRALDFHLDSLGGHPTVEHQDQSQAQNIPPDKDAAGH